MPLYFARWTEDREKGRRNRWSRRYLILAENPRAAADLLVAQEGFRMRPADLLIFPSDPADTVIHLESEFVSADTYANLDERAVEKRRFVPTKEPAHG